MTILPKKKQSKQQTANDEQHEHHNVVVVGGTAQSSVVATGGGGGPNQLSTNGRVVSQWSSTRNVVGNGECPVDKRPAPDNGHATHGSQHSSKRRHRNVQRNM
ncbi:hypothetical protein BLA29_004324 [Euroglyphus maynei]|uniref:Uncharacterized protein n=1 Tax=Euroglyphus maynei TaxID=6958 RepID=A0A1Y3B931_EURMA|nr:hypothetical protein BLA29_004324 [Euroglyphus maynei]